MKQDIHPQYHHDCKVYFRGDVVMTVGATVPEIHVEVWSGSHPFYTGQKTFVDTAGRVERFQRKFAGGYFGKGKDGGKDKSAAASAPKQ
ncbi:MAG: 50S ribosomal protein L31 [Phycisphaerales bacterium]|nr:50S ribosomal protein L31 [Phycisphaerales bacterium]